MIKKEIIYFKKPGLRNTDDVIKEVKKRILKSNIEHIVVASTSGKTALRVAEAFKETPLSIICVAEHTGFAGEGIQLLSEDNKKELQKMGVKILIGTHALSGVERSISIKCGGISPVETIAFTLRQFGCEGIKVAVEISIMAADAGIIPTDREIIAISGSGKGADTAVILKASHMNNYFDLEIREIIAKPRQRK